MTHPVVAAAERRGRLRVALLTALLLVPLGACGKKPALVDSKETKAAHPFPAPYPNPALDPKP